ncbi:beta-lactamase domain-containing protein [Penicillium herquei]|nr:beta-lactamase domain-containing protein [Penicillium herquei]
MSSAGGVRSPGALFMIYLNGGKVLLASSQHTDPELPLYEMGTVLSGHAFVNKSSGLDELYALSFGKVTLPAQLGKMGFNPGLVDSMSVIRPPHESNLVFYHNGAIPGYKNCLMLLPSHQVIIFVLTNSISHGDTADWVAQALLQAVLDIKHIDIIPLAKQAASKWKDGYQAIAEALARERTLNTGKPPHDERAHRNSLAYMMP